MTLAPGPIKYICVKFQSQINARYDISIKNAR